MKLFSKIAIAALFSACCSAHAISLTGITGTYNGHNYAEITADTWLDSEAYAVSLGGHLVAVNDLAENNFLISTFGSQHSLWIGLYRTTPHAATWAWTNGDAVTFTNWAGGEPNDAGGEDYTHTYISGEWNDLNNTNSYSGEKYGIIEWIQQVNVPEPSALLMALAGFGFLGIARRRMVQSNK